MTNKYSKRIKTIAERENLSASNKRKVEKLTLLASDKSVAQALDAQKVDIARFDARALYATEKCIKIVHAVTRDTLDLSELNANAFVTIKSAILAKRAEKALTKRDIECALSSDQKHDDARADVIYKRKNVLSASTLAAQSQQCVDMLRTLKIATETAKNVFEINDSALMQTFESKLADVTM